MFGYFHTGWILQGQSALLHYLSSGVCSRLNGYIEWNRKGWAKDNAISDLLLPAFLLTGNPLREYWWRFKFRLCLREVDVCMLLPSTELRDYSGCVSLPCFTGGGLVENCSYSVFWPVNTFALSRQFKIINVYTDVIEKRHEVGWDEVGAFFTVYLWAILLSTLFQMRNNSSRMK